MMLALGRHWRAQAKLAICVVTIAHVLGACHRGPTPYRTAMLDAESARREGRFEKERKRFEDASRLAKNPNDANEARYRRAQSFAREGRFETGARQLESFARTFPKSHRAARAWLDAGRNWERANEPEKALSAFTKVIEVYGNSGGALSAATRIVALKVELQGVAPHEEWRKLLENNRAGELDEGLRYRYAQALENVSPSRALLAYEDVAKKHPLPGGSHTDEALLQAAILRIQLEDPIGAIETLDLLLEQGGPAAIVGSYTRTAYVEALLLKGKLLRDALDRPSEALKIFLSLSQKHPDSRLVDDALWEAVRTERRLGQSGCSSLEVLLKNRPQSRFARCKAQICGGQSDENPNADRCLRWLDETGDSQVSPAEGR